MEFGNSLKAIRQKSFLSQADFAKELGVSFVTVHRWETGKNKPSYKTMKQIDEFCKARGIDFDVAEELQEEK